MAGVNAVWLCGAACGRKCSKLKCRRIVVQGLIIERSTCVAWIGQSLEEDRVEKCVTRESGPWLRECL